MKVKCKHLMVLCLAILLISLLAAAAPGQEIFQFQAHKTKLEVLPESTFTARFGANPDVPRTDAGIIALVRKLYPPPGEQQPELGAKRPAARLHRSREYELGVLFAALQNPAISDLTRQQVDLIIQETIPPLPKTYTSGHYKFNYTDNNRNLDHNVTLAQIQDTAAKLNSYWDTYSANFKTPKHYNSGGEEMLDINVYYLGDGLFGETGSGLDYINLSSKLTVRDPCKRRTVSAHELFHRVQYSYGYISGMARMLWIVEGTADWAMRYTNIGIRDYMDTMNDGLKAPNVNLIKDRDYDACHFWVYLQELAGTWAALKDLWVAYEDNGKNGKAAVNTVTTKRLNKTFDQFAQTWIKANYLKDLDNAGDYGYDENKVSQTTCGVTHGPLILVPRTTQAIADNSTSFSLDRTVLPYGANYFDFPLGADLTQLRVRVTGEESGNFSYHFIGVKNNSWQSIINRSVDDYTYSKTLASWQWDRLVLVVAGRSKGGDYTIKVGPQNEGRGTFPATP